MISRTLVFSAAVLLFSPLIFFPGASAARAQGDSTSASSASSASRPQSDSLGDAARQARAQKPHSAKPAKVFTNDDVHGLKDSFSPKSHSKQTSHTRSSKPPSPR